MSQQQVQLLELPQLPQSAQDRLTKIEKQYKIPMQTLLNETQIEFSQNFIQQFTILDTAEKKVDYATKVVANRYNTRNPLENYDVIVWGVSAVKYDKGYVYVLVEEDKRTGKPVVSGTEGASSTTKRYQILFQGKDTEILKTVQTGAMYTVALGTGKAKGTLYGDDRTIFENPVSVDGVFDLLRQTGVKDITIAEIPNNIAKVDASGYTDNLDVKIIRGMIGDYRKDPNGDWAFYVISDDSLAEEKVTADGELVMKPSLTVWMNPMFVVYERNNMLEFVGLITAAKGSKDKPKKKPYETSMAGYNISPLMTPYGEITE